MSTITNNNDMPLGIAIQKGTLFIFKDGEVIERPAPSVELMLPYSQKDDGYYDSDGNDFVSYSRIPQSRFKVIKDKYYFIGVNKYNPGDDAGMGYITNEALATKCLQISYQQWANFYAKELPFSYTEYMLITKKEEVLSKYKHTKPIKLMYFDIEVCTDGTGVFPKADRNPIAMIGWATSDKREVNIVESFKPELKGTEDSQILIDFMAVIEQENPDILVSYNGWSFDMPYILRRANITCVDMNSLLGIPKDKIAKSKELTSYCTYCLSPENDVNLGNLGRRLHYDIFQVDVLRDQLLAGIKNRRMKTLGKHYFADDEDEIVEMEEGIENLWKKMLSEEGRAEIKKYLTSDIKLTMKLSDFYFEPNNLTIAGKLNVPLNIVINRRNATIPTLYIMEKMIKRKMIPISTNSRIYDTLTRRSEKNFNETKFFQGAYVQLHRRGKIINPIKKVDFSSLYPNCARSLNLSYETLTMSFKLVDEMPDDARTYKFWNDGNTIRFQFYDSVLHCLCTAYIDKSRVGLIPEVLDETLGNRKKIRAEMKGLDENSIEYKKKNAEQNFWKVLSNSAYGVLAQRTGIGYLPIGMTITAMGRWVTRQVVEKLNTSMELRT